MSTAGTDRRGHGAWRSLAVVMTATAIVASACSGAATSAPATPAPTAAAPSAAASAAPAGTPAASAAATAAAVACGAYSGPDATIEYAIWGDTTELKNQQAIVDAFMQINPKIKVKVTVADWTTYWDKLQTGLAGGAAPDVFLMDGTLFQDYQTRDVLKDLTHLFLKFVL